MKYGGYRLPSGVLVVDVLSDLLRLAIAPLSRVLGPWAKTNRRVTA